MKIPFSFFTATGEIIKILLLLLGDGGGLTASEKEWQRVRGGRKEQQGQQLRRAGATVALFSATGDYELTRSSR
jgi:hypothetical protein